MSWRSSDCLPPGVYRLQIDTLRCGIEALFDEKPPSYSEDHFRLFQLFKDALNTGQARAAEPDTTTPSGWRVNGWVKKGILLVFIPSSSLSTSCAFSVGGASGRDTRRA